MGSGVLHLYCLITIDWRGRGKIMNSILVWVWVWGSLAGRFALVCLGGLANVVQALTVFQSKRHAVACCTKHISIGLRVEVRRCCMPACIGLLVGSFDDGCWTVGVMCIPYHIILHASRQLLAWRRVP